MRIKQTNIIARLLTYLACIIMLSNPILHANSISNSDEDWVWLCTNGSYSYVNFNADSDDKADSEQRKQCGASCCSYDFAPETALNLFPFVKRYSQVIEQFNYRVPNDYTPSYYFSRAPPLDFS